MPATLSDKAAVEKQIAVPDAAFLLGYHELTPNEMAGKQQAAIKKRPTCKFKDLQPGKVYAYKGSRDGYTIYVVEKVTPTGKQADLRQYGEDGEFRAHSGSYTYDFILLNDVLISFLGVTHEMIVAEAVKRGLEVPPRVRRYHPHLFIEIPERYATPDHPDVLKRGTAGDRVKNALHPFYSFKVVGPKNIQKIIDTANAELARFLDHGLKAKALNPKVETFYDRAAADFHSTIDFYTWLLPLVSEGGVFFVEQPADQPDEMD